MEKKKVVDRSAGIHNAIPVVMKQFSMNEQDAKTFVKGLTVDAEDCMWKLGLDLKKTGSESIKAYVDAMILLMGANGFWSATCPRYNSTSLS
jgi:hypothetical protein